MLSGGAEVMKTEVGDGDGDGNALDTFRDVGQRNGDGDSAANVPISRARLVWIRMNVGAKVARREQQREVGEV